VADLLECLIQINALRHTTSRLAELARTVGPERWTAAGDPLAGLAAAMIAAEEALAAFLVAALPHGPSLAHHHESSNAQERPSRRPGEAPHTWRFFDLRHTNLAVLDRCSAEDLSQRVSSGDRRETTIADMVAIMLARDTVTVGELRAHLALDSAPRFSRSHSQS
jgi:hypothetical protein